MDKRIGFGLYQSLLNRGEYWACVFVLDAVVCVVLVRSGWGSWTRDWKSGVLLCLREL